MNELDEIVQEFLVESYENLDQLDQDLVALEQDPGSRALVSSIFRTIHTIKGTSGFLGFGQLESVTHVGESLLSRLRDGALTLDQPVTDGLLALVDAVRTILAGIEATGAETPADHAALVARLEALQSPAEPAAGSRPTEAAGAVPAQPAPVEAAEPAGVAAGAHAEPVGREAAVGGLAPHTSPAASTAPAQPAVPAEPAQPAASAAPAQPAVPAEPAQPAASAPPLGELLVASGVVSEQDVLLARLAQEVGDARPLGEILIGQGAARPAEVERALDSQAERRGVAESSIRVDVDLLDSLMRLVGELVLTRNQIVAQAQAASDTTLVRSSMRLNLIASELQEGVMKTRMQPIDTVWNKFPRIVRDLGAQCGKQVRLAMEGRDTELDRTLLEAIKDPLTHLVRNAVDHGVEPPAVREAAGKPAEGTLQLRAFHEGGQVNIEIRDDGAGMDPRRIAAKALERGLVSAEALAGMTEREVLGFIFAPGFSTAAAVTNVSGRGVGMDVVKTNIEKIGGTVDVTSSVGVGTTLRIKIPLTLAIIPALTVTCAGDRYAIPQVNLVELVRLAGEQARTAIEHISGTPVYRLRGNLLPLVYLDEVLELAGERSADRDTVYIVVLAAEDRQFGLVVDDVLNTEEIVVKPLSQQLKAVRAFAGATILGDGLVALILDVLAVAQQAHVLNRRGGRAGHERMVDVRGTGSDRESLLVVAAGADRRLAIPLSMVTRLEEFRPDVVEHVGAREVVQYRGRILPLVRLSRLLGAGTGDAAGPLQVVVYSSAGRSVGLVVDRILDIVDESVTRSDVTDFGSVASAVVQQRITELLDVRAAILAADPHFYDAQAVTTG